MKTIRLLVYFLIGLLLGATAVLSHAVEETRPVGAWRACFNYATTVYNGGACAITSYHASCAEARTALYGYFLASPNAGAPKKYRNDACAEGVSTQLFNYDTAGAPFGGVLNYYASRCPDGYVLSGTQCVLPPCPDGQMRDQTTGQCIAQCPMYPGDSSTPDAQPSNCQCPAGTQWVPLSGCRKKCTGSGETAGAQVWGDPTIFYTGTTVEGCYNGCGVQPQSDVYYRANGGRYFDHSTYTGWACGGNGKGTKPTPDGKPEPNQPEKPPGTPHEPKCNGENVVTRSDGTVVCMPAGTPNTHKPKTEEVKKSEQYSDGSSKETTTHTTTDPGTGAKYYITTTTITPATGGGAGAAGTPGTSTGTTKGGTTGGGSGAGKDGGECDPTSQFCGGPSGDLWEGKEKTFDQALNKFRAGVAGTPIGAATTGFFAVSVPNGSCPSWQVAVPVLDVTLNLSQYFCTAEAIQMMDLVGAVLLALVSFVAFRWAVL